MEETREDSNVKVHKDECKIINDEESGAVKVLALFISFSRCSSKRGRTGEHYCRYCRHNKRYSQFYKQKILKVLEESVKKDRSKIQIVGFTPLDLLEMTRKHICSND